jgi:hypothetical protein
MEKLQRDSAHVQVAVVTGHNNTTQQMSNKVYKKRNLKPRTQCLTDQNPYRFQTEMFLEFRE